jgi:hypothetical protein
MYRVVAYLSYTVSTLHAGAADAAEADGASHLQRVLRGLVARVDPGAAMPTLLLQGERPSLRPRAARGRTAQRSSLALPGRRRRMRSASRIIFASAGVCCGFLLYLLCRPRRCIAAHVPILSAFAFPAAAAAAAAAARSSCILCRDGLVSVAGVLARLPRERHHVGPAVHADALHPRRLQRGGPAPHATSAPGLGLPLPRLHRNGASGAWPGGAPRHCHRQCKGTGLSGNGPSGAGQAVLPDIFEALVSEELFAKYRRCVAVRVLTIGVRVLKIGIRVLKIGIRVPAPVISIVGTDLCSVP